ncbi:MAG TPA: [NiFe]-hydrogenase assembly chaperone HybE [Rhodocyclaceae bacterium]|nr:[NiFe]-hydrogenase assembly chaperone HybE [Rhodocyclaceae bacterium]
MVRVHAGNPAPQVEAAFRRIEKERMAGLPFLNPALRVEAVGFDLHEGQWLGVVVTPWAMSLLLVPGAEDGWVSAPEGRRLMIDYPAGKFAFLGGHEDEIGEYLSCPLMTSMAQFIDQETARLTALGSLHALMRNPDAEPVAETPPSPARRRFFLHGS